MEVWAQALHTLNSANENTDVSLVLSVSVVVIVAFCGLITVLNSLGMVGYVELLESEDNFGGKIGFVYLALAMYLLITIYKSKDRESVESKLLSLFTICVIIQFFVYVAPVLSVVLSIPY